MITKHHFIGFIILMTAISLILPSLLQAQTTPPLQAAEEAFSRGDYEKAREQFTAAFQSSNSLEAATGLAETLLKLRPLERSAGYRREGDADTINFARGNGVIRRRVVPRRQSE